jgi:4-hydroxybenzoate polyprenyltransferase
MPIRALLLLCRPSHWVKNVFVLMPLPFAMAAGAEIEPASFALGLLGFCFANSAVYAFNDAQDAERDRLHPKKRTRPVAAGLVSVAAARGVSAVLLGLALLLTATSGHPGAVVVTAGYAALNLGYNLGGKHVPLVDVFLLASYYVLRVTLGCVLVDVVPSNWLLLCTTTLALFLALAKRRADITMGLDGEHRPALDGYTKSFLDHAMGVTAATTLIAYALYCLEAEVLVPGREFASVPLVAFVVLEYLRLAHVKNEGGSPVDLVLRSPLLLSCAVGWLVAVLWSVGWTPSW